MTDIIDHLVGTKPGSALDAIRAHRHVARDQAQASYTALLAPADPGSFPINDRFAVAAFVAGITSQPDIAAFYAKPLAANQEAAITAAIATAHTTGPYGAYPPGPLSVENTTGPIWHPGPDTTAALGAPLAAALAHAHMLVFHPRDAAPEHLQALYDAGWSTTAIVTLSQLVAFLAFQIRTVAGLRVLESTL